MKKPVRWMNRQGKFVFITDMDDKHIENAMKDLAKGIKLKTTIPSVYNHALCAAKPPITTIQRFHRWARNRLGAFRSEQRLRGVPITVGTVR